MVSLSRGYGRCKDTKPPQAQFKLIVNIFQHIARGASASRLAEKLGSGLIKSTAIEAHARRQAYDSAELIADGRARRRASRRPARDQRDRARAQVWLPLVRLPGSLWSADDDL
jgi:hypothetical protein